MAAIFICPEKEREHDSYCRAPLKGKYLYDCYYNN